MADLPPIVVFHDDHEECDKQLAAAKADLLEEQQRRRELTAERDDARERAETYRRYGVRDLARIEELEAERDEAREEVVRLGKITEKQATEIERLRTVIRELGAGEAAEPPDGKSIAPSLPSKYDLERDQLIVLGNDQRCPRCGDARPLHEKWGVCTPCAIDERWEDAVAGGTDG